MDHLFYISSHKTLMQIILIFNLFHFISLTKDDLRGGEAMVGVGTMEVKLISAEDLKRSDFLIGKIEPYVVIQYRNEKQTSRTAQGMNPVWNQVFKFRVEFPAFDGNDSQKKYNLFLNISDRDSHTKDDDLGTSKIYLKELFQEGFEKGKSDLGTQKYRVVLGDLTYKGEIKVGITFTASANKV